MSIFLRGIRRSDGATVEVEHTEGAEPEGFYHGQGNPNGVVDAISYGDVYRDVDNGALYMATASNNSSWVLVAGNSADQPVTGVDSHVGAINLITGPLGGRVAVAGGSGNDGGSATVVGGSGDFDEGGQGGPAGLVGGNADGDGSGGSVEIGGGTGASNGGTGNGGFVSIAGGGSNGSGEAGSVIIAPGQSSDGIHGRTDLRDANGDSIIQIGPDLQTLGFFAAEPHAQENLGGALSDITDDAAKTVLTNLISIFANLGLLVDETT